MLLSCALECHWPYYGCWQCRCTVPEQCTVHHWSSYSMSPDCPPYVWTQTSVLETTALQSIIMAIIVLTFFIDNTWSLQNTIIKYNKLMTMFPFFYIINPYYHDRIWLCQHLSSQCALHNNAQRVPRRVVDL